MAEDPNDDLKTMGVFVGSAVMLGFIIWYFFEEHIKSAIRWLRIGELRAIAWFLDGDEKNAVIRYADHVEAFDKYIWQFPPEQKDGIYAAAGQHFVIEPSQYVLQYAALPVAVILGLLGFYILIKGTKHKLRRRLNLETMIEAHSRAFPITAPIHKFNPIKVFRAPGDAVPARLPMFAEALSPEEWVAYHAIPMPDNRLDKKALHNAFKKQLKGRWHGAQKLPAHLQVLFVAFAMKANGLRSESDEFLGDVAKCWNPKTNRLHLTHKIKKEVKNKIKHPKFGRVMEKVAAQHSFITTAMLRMLQMAREEGGVLAPASFLWLRAVDRTVWYPLNNLGRQSFHVEASGGMSHFKAERSANRPIPTPQVASSIEALQEYFETRMPVVPPRDSRMKISKKGA